MSLRTRRSRLARALSGRLLSPGKAEFCRAGHLTTAGRPSQERGAARGDASFRWKAGAAGVICGRGMGATGSPEEDHVDRDGEVDRDGHSRHGESDEDRDYIPAEDGQEFSRFVRSLFALFQG